MTQDIDIDHCRDKNRIYIAASKAWSGKEKFDMARVQKVGLTMPPNGFETGLAPGRKVQVRVEKDGTGAKVTITGFKQDGTAPKVHICGRIPFLPN